MKSTFASIYSKNVWRHGSGEGSLPVHTKGYVDFLQRFLRERAIRSVVDYGCGDWQFSRLIDWTGIQYVGYDVVPKVIEANRAKYGRSNIRFETAASGDIDLPEADLLIVKDVLQHWPNAAIQEFLPVLTGFRYSLITNCVGRSGIPSNTDIQTGDFRPLDIRRAPFCVPASEVYTFENARPFLVKRLIAPRWRKSVLLVEAHATVVPE